MSMTARVLPVSVGVRRWRQVVFAVVAVLAGLFTTVGIGAAYYATSWFMTDPTQLESRIHGVSLGGGMLFLAGLTMLLAARRAEDHPAAVVTAAVGLSVAQLAVLLSLGDELPDEARTNAVINATSIPLPAVLALLLYPRMRLLARRDAQSGVARLLVAGTGAAVALAGAVPLLAAQASAVGTDPFIGSQPRYAETAVGLVMVAVALVVVAVGLRGWQVVAMLAGTVATSVGAAGLVFAGDSGAPGVAISTLLVVSGLSQVAVGWRERRPSQK